MAHRRFRRLSGFSLAAHLSGEIVTVTIAITLLRFLFPEDKKTLAVLHNMRLKIRKSIKKTKKK